MPELPEIETIVKDLKEALPELVVKRVIVHGGYRPKASDLPSTVGSSVSTVDRVGKTVHMVLDDTRRVVFHLAMTGRLLLRRAGDVPDPNQRVSFIFSDGRQLRFTDIRMFGWVELFGEDRFREFSKRYGPDPFEITAEEFAERFLSKKVSVKNVLLDQSLVSGIGNIYANDALWMAEIHPEAKTHKLSGEQLRKLHQAVLDILREGIEHRGSSIDTYVDAYGRAGKHQEHFRVYQKEGEKCARCGSVLRFKQLSGRGTFYCDNCQLLGLGKGDAVEEQIKGQETFGL
ncbi:bifunctional DNA-formamidopyrimidine glycosylase/DNA-(apurinic or apyrimidinic site) lyase [Candidatus Saccharibacteria bacterium]|nr:bifunctional DNA-formamidopyrimidine glycosylase/DNA-(apurinic or apyrimidinic site) lyase [Candidatus Saccharibacteria bacterium]